VADAYESVFQALYLLIGEEDLVDLAESGVVEMLHEDLLTKRKSATARL
jgi:hypothetical protein